MRDLRVRIARPALGRTLVVLAVGATVVAVSSCTPAAPATPTLISVQGHGTFSMQNNIGNFRFSPSDYNETTHTLVRYITSTVRFSVPYPTAIELAIGNKPLTKVDRPITTNYEYSGEIENPGANPATWKVAIRTPFDVPYDAAYTLTVIDVSRSNRSQPLTVHYTQPLPFQPTVMTASSTVGSDDTTPPAATSVTGPCAGGSAEHTVWLCLRKPPFDPKSLGVSACSYDAARRLVQSGYADWQISSGPCGP